VRFSDTSYLLLFAFLVLHEVGAHYTYAKVPYDDWIHALTGGSLDQAMGFPRNEFDRLVHFLYGLLLTPAICELVEARARPASPLWRAFLPWSVVVAFSAVFELIEWAAALLFGGSLGVAYLGTQGDVWDAQQDMLLAAVGSLIAVLVIARRGPAR
jgi:putative membrane protein